MADREPGQTAEPRQQQALDDHLTHQPAAARAERGAHRHFALTRARANEEEIRDVHAGEQKDQAGDREAEELHQRERVTDGPQRQGPGARLRNDSGGDAAIGLGILALERRHQHVGRGLGVGDAHVRLKPREYLKRPRLAVVVQPAPGRPGDSTP